MRWFVVVVCLAASLCGWLAPSGSAVSRVDCSYLTARGTAVNKAQLAFTKQAYSDGTITPDEAAEAGFYTSEIAAITKALYACITGVAAPTVSGFVLSGESWETSSGHSLVIRWDTNQPAKAEIIFQHKVNGQELEVGAIRVAVGQKSVSFSGKAGTVQIKPGRYLLTLVTTNAKGAESKPASRPLTVLP